MGYKSFRTGIFITRRKDIRALSLALSMHAQKKGHVRHREKAAIYKPRKELSSGTELASTLIWDFCLPDL